MELVEHPRRPVRLDGEQLAAHPDAREADCVVWFPVPDAVEGGPEAEGVPAKRLDGDRARLCGIPLFPYHAAFGDEVQVREQDGTLYCVEVVHAAPVIVARIFHEGGAEIPTEQALSDPTSDEPFWSIARALAPHGVWFERYSTTYAALLVAPDEWEYVRAFLELRQRATNLRYELATPLRAPSDDVG